jgi:hypothetical protein
MGGEYSRLSTPLSKMDDPGPTVVPGCLGIKNPRKSGSVIGADRQRFDPSCVLLKRCHKAEYRVGVSPRHLLTYGICSPTTSGHLRRFLTYGIRSSTAFAHLRHGVIYGILGNCQ